MPTYLLTSPDGKQYRVTGEGTGEEALAQLQSQIGSTENESPDNRVTPIGDYNAIRKEGLNTMSEGVEALKRPTGGDLLGSVGAAGEGVGKLLGGGLQYAASPRPGAQAHPV